MTELDTDRTSLSNDAFEIDGSTRKNSFWELPEGFIQKEKSAPRLCLLRSGSSLDEIYVLSEAQPSNDGENIYSAKDCKKNLHNLVSHNQCDSKENDSDSQTMRPNIGGGGENEGKDGQ